MFVRVCAALLLAFAAGCATPTTAAPPAAAAPPVAGGEAGYLAELRAAGANPAATDAALLNLGTTICSVIGAPGVTRAAVVNEVAVNGHGQAWAQAYVAAAERHLCPGKRYAGPDGGAPAAAPPTLAGGIPGDGTFLVGPDIAAGTYRTAGPSGGSACYWTRRSGTTGAFEEIIANGRVKGPTVVTIPAGDVAFESQGCQVWEPVK